jgi:hypothetical protein
MMTKKQKIVWWVIILALSVLVGIFGGSQLVK